MDVISIHDYVSDRIKKKIECIQTGSYLYLHPQDKKDDAFIGSFRGVEEYKGIDSLVLEPTITFTSMATPTGILWVPCGYVPDGNVSMLYPLQGLVDGTHALYGPNEIRKGMRENSNQFYSHVCEVVTVFNTRDRSKDFHIDDIEPRIACRISDRNELLFVS